MCSGAFDGLHSGHVAYLEAAKALAPQLPLAVAVAPDSYIRSAKQREPYWTQSDRMQTVAALKVVDTVYRQRDSLAEIIESARPRYVVKGNDWRGQMPADVRKACSIVGATILYTDTERTHTRQARG